MCDEITLKALANFSPGFALKPWDHAFIFEDATLSQLLQSREESLVPLLNPGFQSKPWGGISERFQRY
jgi:hypothetical protein